MNKVIKYVYGSEEADKVVQQLFALGAEAVSVVVLDDGATRKIEVTRGNVIIE